MVLEQAHIGQGEGMRVGDRGGVGPMETADQIRPNVRLLFTLVDGNYRIVAKLFNMAPNDYKRFLNFLRKHDCQLPFKEYRQ